VTVTSEDENTLTSDCGWTVTRTYTVTDGCNHSVTKTMSVSGSDQTDPTFTKPADITICCSGNLALDTVPAATGNVTDVADNCTAEPTVTYVDGTITGDEHSTRTFVRTWTVTDACGNSATDEQTITINPQVVMNTPENQAICEGQALNVTFGTTITDGTVTYAWSRDNTENIYGDEAGTGNIADVELTMTTTASNSQPVVFTVTPTYTNNGKSCEGTPVTFTVTVNALPTVTLSAIDNVTAICEGETTRLQAGCETAEEYEWHKGNATIDGETDDVLVVSEAGKYVVLVTDDHGCSNVSDTVTITVNELPTVTLSAENDLTVICGNATLSLIAESDNAEEYAWFRDNAAIEYDDNVMDITEAGVYVVTVTDENGCSSSSEPLTITARELPTVALSAVDNVTSICAGENTTLQADCETAVAYEWHKGNATIDEETAAVMVVSEAGKYTVMVTDEYGCSNTSDTVTITVNALPTVTLAAIDDVTAICEGETTKLQAGCETAEEYEWHKGNATIAGETDDLLEISEAGKYVVLVTDGNGCSNTSDTVTITVYELPDVTITGAESVCYGSTTTLTASGAESYSWSDDRTDESINVTITEETTITVTGTDSHNCSATDEITIAVNALPTVTLTITKDGEDVEIDNNTIDICLGGTLTISAPEADGYSYEWGRGSAELEENSETLTLEDIAATDAGKYAVKVTDANGCSNTSDSLTVIVNALPDVNASVTDVTCTELGSVTLTVNGTPDFTCSWNDGETVNITEQNADELYIITFNELEGNEYSYVITDGNGCVTEDQVVVTDPGTVSARQSIANAESCYGEDNDITFTITGGAPTYMVQWVNVNNSEILAEMDEVTNEETTITLNELEAGEYRLAMVITDVNECTGNAIDTIEFTIWPTYNIVREINIGTGLDEYTFGGQTYAISNGIPEIPETEELETAHGCDSIISYVVNQYDLEIIFADTCILTRSSYNRAYTNTPNELLGDTIYLAKNTPSYFYAYLNNTTETTWNGERMDMSYELQYSEQAISEDDMPNLVENFSISTYYDRSGAYYGVTDLTEPTGEIPSTTFAFRQTANSTIMQFDYFYFEAFKNIPNKVTFTGLENGTYTLKLKAELRNSDPETGTDRNGIYNPYIVNRRYGHILGGYGDTVGTKEVIAARNLTIIVNEDGVNPSGAPAAINEYSHEASVRSFPNPVNDQLNLVINGMEGNTQITITDAQGKVVRVINAELTGGTEVLTYSVSDFAQGIYFLNVRNSEKVISQKFIVTKR
jgi:hypothetical protein